MGRSKHVQRASPDSKSTNTDKPDRVSHGWQGKSLFAVVTCGVLAMGIVLHSLQSVSSPTSTDSQSSKLALSPGNVARVCLESQQNESYQYKKSPFDKDSFLKRGYERVYSGDVAGAAALFLEILHNDPLDQGAIRLLVKCFKQLYANRGSTEYNFTHGSLARLQELAHTRAAVDMGQNRPAMTIKQVHTNPPIFLLENLLSEEECDMLVEEYEHLMNMYQGPNMFPVFCFQHDQYLDHPVLQQFFIGSGTNSTEFSQHKFINERCLNQKASNAISQRIIANYSYSLSAYSGQSALLDNIRKRLGQAVGLKSSHSWAPQFLEYTKGVEYSEHTDCGYLRPPLEDRFATFLAPLVEDYIGGETDFPLAQPPLSLRVPRGTGIVFWNRDVNADGSVGQCNRLSTHSSSVVTSGRKLILQNWFAFSENAFRAQAPKPPEWSALLPHQPWVSCDWTGDDNAAEGISCRWYNNCPIEL